jgi:hypothetical protein
MLYITDELATQWDTWGYEIEEEEEEDQLQGIDA